MNTTRRPFQTKAAQSSQYNPPIASQRNGHTDTPQTLEDFIEVIPDENAYKQTFVDLYKQIDAMKLHDDDFLRREKDRLKNHLDRVLNWCEVQTDKWFENVMAETRARVVSSHSSFSSFQTVGFLEEWKSRDASIGSIGQNI